MSTHPLRDYVLAGSDPSKKHVRLEKFKEDLTTQLQRPFAKQSRPYNHVNVFLFSWEQADSNNCEDVTVVKEFLESEFNFHCTEYKIPSDTAFKPDYKSLRKALLEFEDRSSKDTLSILFYSGHGYSNIAIKDTNPGMKHDLILFPSKTELEALGENFLRNNGKPFGVPYDYICSMLLTIEGDVLHLLECCAGGGAAGAAEHEIIAASAFKENARRNQGYTPSGHFARALMDSMRSLKDTFTIFTTAQLAAQMQGQGRWLIPPLLTQPVYIARIENKACICLTPLLPSNTPAHLRPQPPPKLFDKRTDKALLSISFDKDVEAVAGDIHAWLTSRDRPDYVKDVKIAGNFVGRSTVVLITVPFLAWLVLEENPAYKLLEFVPSDNLLLTHAGRSQIGVPEIAVDPRFDYETASTAPRELAVRPSRPRGSPSRGSPSRGSLGEFAGRSTVSSFSENVPFHRGTSGRTSSSSQRESSPEKRKQDFTSGSQHPAPKC